MVGEIVFVVAADLQQSPTGVVALGPESLSAIITALGVSKQWRNCPVYAYAGYSVRFSACMGRLMMDEIRNGLPHLEDPSAFATTFNTVGEVRAFWAHMAVLEVPPSHVYPVARGIHCYRVAWLLKRLRPPSLAAIEVTKPISAPSADRRLWLHEFKSWAKILLLVMQQRI